MFPKEVETPTPEAEALPQEPAKEEKKEPEFESQEEILTELQRRYPNKPRKELLKESWNSYRAMEKEFTQLKMKEADERRNPPRPAEVVPSVDDLSEKYREEFVANPLSSSVNLIDTILTQRLNERLGPIEKKTQTQEIQANLTRQFAEIQKEPYFEDVKDDMLATINELEQTDPAYARAVSQRPDFLKKLYKEALGNKIPVILEKSKEELKSGKEKVVQEKVAAQVATGGVHPPAKPLTPEEQIRQGIITASRGQSFG